MDALIAMEYIAETKEIEIGQLIMRYGHIRVHRPEIASSLMNSVERCGQIIPVITVKESDLSFVLIDGYLRVAALKRCGKDTVAAEIWQCNEQNALIRVLMKNQERRWEPLEEALLIKELLGQHNISQAKIAQLVGRNQSWISRRIALVHALPDEILGLVQKGRISTNEGPGAYGARHTGSCKGPGRKPYKRAHLHPRSHGTIPSLSEIKPQTQRQDSEEPRAFQKSAPCGRTRQSSHNPQTRARGQMA